MQCINTHGVDHSLSVLKHALLQIYLYQTYRLCLNKGLSNNLYFQICGQWSMFVESECIYSKFVSWIIYISVQQGYGHYRYQAQGSGQENHTKHSKLLYSINITHFKPHVNAQIPNTCSKKSSAIHIRITPGLPVLCIWF